MTIPEFEQLIGILVKTGAGIGAVVLIIKHFKSIVSYLKGFALMPEKIRVIEAETKTNGGSSIRDALNRIEKRQLIQEQRVLFIFDFFNEFGTFEGDPEGHCIRCSVKFCDFFDKNQDELIGNSWVNNIHPEDRDRVFKEFKDAVNQKRSFHSLFRINRNLEVIMVEFKVQPIMKDGAILNWFGVLKKSL